MIDRRSALAVAVVAVLVGSSIARSADEGAVRALRARALARRGQCESAAQVLARRDTTVDARALFDLGRCRIGQQDFASAVDPLERALEMDPSLAEAQLYIGIARYHQRNLDEAEAALEAARAAGVEDAQLELYAGLLQLDRGDAPKAAATLERARRQDAGRVEPLASYYESLALVRGRQMGEARRALRRVAEGAPGSPWAHEAERALDRLGTVQPGRSWVVGTLGVEYDDNVMLRGSGVELPEAVAGQSDPRLVWAAEAGTVLVRAARWRGGVMGSYYGSEHDEQDDFNLQVPGLALWLDYDVSEASIVRLRYDFLYSWVGGDSFVSGNSLTTALHHDWGRAGRTRLYNRLYQTDYRYAVPQLPDVPGVNEKSDRNRDGNGLSLGLEHALPLGVADAELSGGYSFNRYYARGADYSYQAHEVWLGSEWRLPFATWLGLNASYTYQPYRNPSSYPDPGTLNLENAKRRDQVIRFEAVLERALNPLVTASARYSVVNNISNTDVFDYNQQIFGLYFTVRLER